MTRLCKGIVAAAALLAVAHPASAAPVAYTIFGSVIAGQDLDRVFGGAEDLGGLAFTAVETFDPSKAQWSWNGTTGSDAGSAGGGFASAALTIGNGTKRLFTGASSLSSAAGWAFFSEIKNSFDELGFSIASPQIKADYMAGNTIDGLKSFYSGHYTLKDASGAQILWANFEVNTLTVVAAVPLPASAPLFGAGLLGLAAVAWGRQRMRGRVAA